MEIVFAVILTLGLFVGIPVITGFAVAKILMLMDHRHIDNNHFLPGKRVQETGTNRKSKVEHAVVPK